MAATTAAAALAARPAAAVFAPMTDDQRDEWNGPVCADGFALFDGKTGVMIHEADGTTTYAVFQRMTPGGRAYCVTGPDQLAGRRRFVRLDQITSVIRPIVADLYEWVIINYADENDRDPLTRISVGPLPHDQARGIVRHWNDTATTPYAARYYMRRATLAELRAFAEPAAGLAAAA